MVTQCLSHQCEVLVHVCSAKAKCGSYSKVLKIVIKLHVISTRYFSLGGLLFALNLQESQVNNSEDLNKS